MFLGVMKKAKLTFKYVPDITKEWRTLLRPHCHARESEFRHWLNECRPNLKAMVVYRGNKIVGWSCIHLDHGRPPYIGVFIDKPHRREGLATKAISRLLSKTKGTGIKEVMYYCGDFCEQFERIIKKNKLIPIMG